MRTSGYTNGPVTYDADAPDLRGSSGRRVRFDPQPGPLAPSRWWEPDGRYHADEFVDNVDALVYSTDEIITRTRFNARRDYKPPRTLAQQIADTFAGIRKVNETYTKNRVMGVDLAKPEPNYESKTLWVDEEKLRMRPPRPNEVEDQQVEKIERNTQKIKKARRLIKRATKLMKSLED